MPFFPMPASTPSSSTPPPLVPVILSGGSGTRLWPVSRAAHPKPFMLLADGESLLQKTYLRAARVSGAQTFITVTNREYFFSSRDTLHKALPSADPGCFLLENQGRNTAAAIVMATLQAQSLWGTQATLLVLPADHLISDEAAFAAAVLQARRLAADGRLVTFGIRPDRPETGFGYIQTGQTLSGGFAVERFVEKPALEKAREYLASGRFLWNSGMFCFQVQTLLDEAALHAPELLATCQACFTEIAQDPRGAAFGFELPAESYGRVPDISFDHALMEKSARVAVVPADMGWSDIGSWTAVRDLVPEDAQHNRALGEAVFVDSENTYVHAGQRLVATVGTRNLIIVDTPDALLVADANESQKVKDVVTRLKQLNHPTFRLHQTVARPWGTYTVLGEGPRYKLKRIEVHPGASLSLQMHHHRNEHWIVVSGVAEVTNGENVFLLACNESTYIPAEHKHRLHNPGPDPLVMIEVQSGSYLGEDDIVRFEDIYGRTN